MGMKWCTLRFIHRVVENQQHQSREGIVRLGADADVRPAVVSDLLTRIVRQILSARFESKGLNEATTASLLGVLICLTCIICFKFLLMLLIRLKYF